MGRPRPRGAVDEGAHAHGAALCGDADAGERPRRRARARDAALERVRRRPVERVRRHRVRGAARRGGRGARDATLETERERTESTKD